MKTTIELPDELIREAKLQAVMQGRALKDLIAEFIRQGLGRQQPHQHKQLPIDSPVNISSDGIPVIRSTQGAVKKSLTLKKLLDLEQQALAQEDGQRVGRSL